MKRYVVFLTSFALLYIGLQILSGFVLTYFYTPDLSLTNQTNQSLSQEVVFGVGQPSVIPFLSILVIATVAYFLSQKLVKENK